MSGSSKVVRADWVFSPDGWIEGGWMLVDGVTGEILEFSKQKPSTGNIGSTYQLEGCAIIPGLVNSHTHLELSTITQNSRPNDYFSWARKIIAHKAGISLEEVKSSFWQSIEHMFVSGTSGCGDITNIPLFPTENQIELDFKPYSNVINRHIFWELIGFNVRDIVDCLNNEQRELFLEREKTEKISLVPHAVYSTSESLIKQSFRWSRSRNKPFSIHIGEHEHEIQFLMEGKGPCRDLLEELGRWNPKWSPPKLSSVEYLDSIGAMDSRTMLVHCVHLSQKDWDIIAKRNCCVCFCFRSNHFLDVGYPNITEALKRNIRIVLGTDSLASNSDLNMFKELEFIRTTTPLLQANDLLFFATYNGLDFFGFPLRENSMLLVQLEGNTREKEIGEVVLENCLQGKFKWMHQDLD